jgi:CubicO group peptidase (beta-lactamase class C family)
MKLFNFLLLFVLAAVFVPLHSQLYFPPTDGSADWEKLDPNSLSWNTNKLDELYSFLEDRKTKAFIILKDGKIVVEKYFNGHQQSKLWYWASAGKSLTSTIVGIAVDHGKIDLQAASHKYLGNTWADINSAQMNAIKVIHHLSMTTGLDESVSFECTDPQCLKFKAAPGTRWAYHNAPYTLLDQIIEGATGLNLNMYFRQELGSKIGMLGSFVKSGYNNVFYSTGRDMARFGLLVLAQGRWNSNIIVSNKYMNDMIKSSQDINPSYGMLWWLNGQEKFMLPGSQAVFNRQLIPTAPSDMYCALGKNDQKLYIIPSQNIVVIRLGDVATDDLNSVPIKFDDELWAKLSEIFRFNTSSSESFVEKTKCHYRHPILEVSNQNDVYDPVIFDMGGKKVMPQDVSGNSISIPVDLPFGHYILKYLDSKSNSKYCLFQVY